MTRREPSQLLGGEPGSDQRSLSGRVMHMLCTRRLTSSFVQLRDSCETGVTSWPTISSLPGTSSAGTSAGRLLPGFLHASYRLLRIAYARSGRIQALPDRHGVVVAWRDIPPP
jgi:hypothetical protein